MFEKVLVVVALMSVSMIVLATVKDLWVRMIAFGVGSITLVTVFVIMLNFHQVTQSAKLHCEMLQGVPCEVYVGTRKVEE